eukprot:g21254.t1
MKLDALFTSFQVAVAQEAKNLQKFLDDMEVFKSSFDALKRSGHSNLPENLIKQWDTLYDAKDRLEKVHDYTMKCQNMEEESRNERFGI